MRVSSGPPTLDAVNLGPKPSATAPFGPIAPVKYVSDADRHHRAERRPAVGRLHRHDELARGHERHVRAVMRITGGCTPEVAPWVASRICGAGQARVPRGIRQSAIASPLDCCRYHATSAVPRR